jgi:formate dehydrogenase major subunit
LSKLKFLVVMDPLQTETARFWENHGEHNDVDPSTINTEVIELPSTCFAEESGSLSNSARWLNWHWAGATPPGEAKHDNWIMGQIFLRLRALYQKEGGTVPEPIVNLDWRYKDPGEPKPEELVKELNGYATEDITDPNDPINVVIAKGKQLVNFSALRDDGKTACGCWVYSGCFNEAGNNMDRRDNSDPSGVKPR